MVLCIDQPRVALPASLVLVVGLGQRAARVVEGLESKPPFSPADHDPRRHLGRLALLGESADRHGEEQGAIRDVPRYLAGQVIVRLEAMLSHAHVSDARLRGSERASWESKTQALILVLADLDDGLVREVLPETLRAVEDLAYERLQPVFPSHLGIQERNLTVLPALVTPHVRATPSGGEIIECVRKLYDQVRGRASERRLVPSLYLLERVTSLSLLGDADVDAILESFVLFVAEALGAAGDSLDPRSVFGVQPNHPLGTFAIARAEPFGDILLEYLLCRVAVRVLRGVQDAQVDVEGVSGRVLTELNIDDLQSRGLDEEAAEYIDRVLEKARLERDPCPAWYAFKEEVPRRYGPDTGNPVVDDDELPDGGGWVNETVGQLEARWQRLVETEFDGLAEKFQQKVGRWEHGSGEHPGFRKRLQGLIDRELLSGPNGSTGPSVDSYRRACQRIDIVSRELERRLQQARTDRERCSLENKPSFERVRSAHAHLLGRARAVPSLPLLGLAVLFFGTVPSIVLGPALFELGTSMVVEAGSFAHQTLVQHPWLSAIALLTTASVLVAVVLFLSRYRVAKAAYGELWDAFEALLSGRSGSVRAYFLSRIGQAWHQTRVGALSRARDAAESDSQRLRDIDRAIVGAVDRYERRLSVIGVVRKRGLDDDIEGLFGTSRRPLIWPLIGAEAAGKFVGDADAQLSRDLDGIVAQAERAGGIYAGWRDQLPYLEDSALDASVETRVRSLFHLPLWRADALRSELSEGLSAFASEFRRTLPIGLPYRARVAADADGVHKAAEALLAPEDLLEVLPADVLEQSRMAPLQRDAGIERAYGVRIFNGIDANVVEWWPRGGQDRSGPADPGARRP